MFLKHFQYFVLILFIIKYFSFITCTTTATDDVQVFIDHEDFKGSVVGKRLREDSGVEYYGFRGIPYAKPPIKELRFKDPQKLDKFEGIRDATHDGFECHSITAQNASEDCLNLNVYSRQLNSSQLLPVVVVIHPGGLYLASGASFFMRPGHMMTQDLVLVTFNYRLNSLGFLNLGSADVPANAGFKDQVFALRWVNKNIAHFGGNPQDVTLLGYSAGGLSVQLHLMSELSKALFHKAIIMSGALPPQTFVPAGQQKYLAVRLAKRLNCSKFINMEEEMPYGVQGKFSDYDQVKDETILECLQQHDGQAIGNILRAMFDFHRDNPIFLWLPVIENDYQQERFLTANITVARKNVLIGYTDGELGSSARDILQNEIIKKKFSHEFNTLAPRIFMYERHANRQLITQKIKQKYFHDSKEFAFEQHDQISDLFSDAIIRFGVQKFAHFLAHNQGLVYFYEFRFTEGQRNGKPDRCEHMSDFQYLFNWTGLSHDSEVAKKMVRLYTDFIYDFVKNGNLSDARAKPFPHCYALIGENIEYKQIWDSKNYEFWSGLFPNYFNLHLN